MYVPSCVLILALAGPFQIASAQTAKTPARKPPSAAKSNAVPAATPAPAVPACTCPPQAQMHVQPYTAKQELTRVQTLAGGGTIRTVEEISLARDAQGRTRRETIRASNGDPAHFFEVWDVATQTRYTWTVGANYPQTVTVYRPRPNPQPPVVSPPPQRYYPYHSESLPPQTIQGVYVQGTRTTRTTPAGYDGNDRDLVTTTENWYAPSVGLQMRLIIDDPRSGKSTTEVTDFHQADPDPALFQPPAGFTLRDANP